MKVTGFAEDEVWTSATTQDTAAEIDVQGYAAVLVNYIKMGTVSAGTIVFEYSPDDRANWYTVAGTRLTTQGVESSYTLTTGTTSWLINIPGATDFRIRLSVAISGAGSATLRLTNLTVATPFTGVSSGGGGGSGDASAANQETIISHIDGVEGLLTTIDADTGNIATSIASIDGKITACNTGAVVISSGSITANAGTNLNTSALALESGGNLAGAAASLAVIDDWDESDRAKVNLIVGQAGIAAGTGTDGATVPRVTLATNVALPAGTNAIGKLAANSGVDIGDVDVTSVPADPFGVNADAASATGSISAKLRFIASTGIPITGTVTVGSHAVTNAGTFVVQENGSALTSLQLIDDTVFTDDAAFTPGTSKVLGVGMQADETSTDSVDEGDVGCPRMTLDRKQIVTPQPHTTGGLSIFRSLDIDETEEDVKTSAGCIYGMWVTNTATSTRWIKFYNATAANTTVGSTTPVITWGIPGNSSDDLSGLFASAHGIMFDTAICVAATTGVADNDSGAPGTNDVIINVFYK